ncbi:hypothetical protein [Gloeocapsa sp. PCC 7428]|nr:hypothetical protein [Gloeocapsa sp. PCC 7428]
MPIRLTASQVPPHYTVWQRRENTLYRSEYVVLYQKSSAKIG